MTPPDPIPCDDLTEDGDPGEEEAVADDPAAEDAVPGDPGGDDPALDPEELLESAGGVVDEDDLEFDDDEDDDEGDEGEADGDGDGDGAEAGAKEPAKKKKKDEDPDLELKWADTPQASAKSLLKALEWAFEGEDVEDGLLERFAEHAKLVLAGNKKMNLTAIVDPKEVAAKHFLDSWRATRLLPLIGRTVLDLGTGPGFPGLPIAMGEPNCVVTCLDSTRKRVDFVQGCIEKLPVKNAKAVWERGEEHLQTEHYEIVLMRAISSVRENVRLLRKVRHSLKDLVLFKGPEWSREVRAAEREAERLGFRLDTVWEHELPGELGQRAILVYRAPGGAGE